mgnify:CR=1 FL=1
MELNEKLQELRKSKGMTQEELAEALYVSRTAISKWESGRGTPSIESLKQISAFFSVSIDDLLSAEKALSLAEQEHKVLQQNQVHLWNGIIDICSAGLIFLPLYWFHTKEQMQFLDNWILKNRSMLREKDKQK